MPHNAPNILSEGEFNKYYMRWLCCKVIEEGGSEVEIYRGKEVKKERQESSQRIGQRLNAQELLEVLRLPIDQKKDKKIGLSAPSSGLTIKRTQG